MENYCLVKQNLGLYVQDSDDDEDGYPDFVPLNGTIIFTPMIPASGAYKVANDFGTILAPITQVEAKVVGGQIRHENKEGIHLFAGGVNSNPESVTYTASYSRMTAAGQNVTLRNVTFLATPGAVIDLSDLTPPVNPIPGMPAGTLNGPRGRRGAAFTFDDFTPEQLAGLSSGIHRALEWVSIPIVSQTGKVHLEGLELATDGYNYFGRWTRGVYEDVSVMDITALYLDHGALQRWKPTLFTGKVRNGLNISMYTPGGHQALHVAVDFMAEHNGVLAIYEPFSMIQSLYATISDLPAPENRESLVTQDQHAMGNLIEHGPATTLPPTVPDPVLPE